MYGVPEWHSFGNTDVSWMSESEDKLVQAYFSLPCFYLIPCWMQCLHLVYEDNPFIHTMSLSSQNCAINIEVPTLSLEVNVMCSLSIFVVEGFK